MLSRKVADAGLFDKQPLFYVSRISEILLYLTGGYLLLFATNSIWTLLLAAVVLAFGFTQIAFIVHDSGHRQVFTRIGRNDILGTICANLGLGLSYGWWVGKHNEHHRHPNHVDLDPDVDVPVIAFTEEQALATHGPARWIVRYQAFFFFPILAFLSASIRMQGFRHLLSGKAKNSKTELALIAVNATLYFGSLFLFLPPLHALLFIFVHQSLFGMYMGLVFATNHKGMPTPDEAISQDPILRQVVTTRNIKANAVSDYIFGNLGTQIEHHLFPNLPRRRLRDAEPIVKEFCRERGISYHETGAFGAYWEVLTELHKVSAPLRR